MSAVVRRLRTLRNRKKNEQDGAPQAGKGQGALKSLIGGGHSSRSAMDFSHQAQYDHLVNNWAKFVGYPMQFLLLVSMDLSMCLCPLHVA